MKFMREHRSIVAMAVMIMAFLGIFLVVNAGGRRGSENLVTAEATRMLSETEADGETEESTGLSDEEFWEVSREFAEQIVNEMSEAPLLDENAKEHYGDSSLESYIADVNACDSDITRELIIALCEDKGLDVDTATVSDLTEDEIIEIDLQTYRASTHPKN